MSGFSGGDFWDGARNGLISAGLNHVAHLLLQGPPYKYNGKTYETKSELYMAILIDQAAEQFGIKDLISLAAALDGAFPSIDKVGALGSRNKTSYASKYLSKIFPQKMPFRLATHLKAGQLRFTKVLGRFLGRMAGPIGWTVLAYDVGATFYHTQIIYNSIVDYN